MRNCILIFLFLIISTVDSFCFDVSLNLGVAPTVKYFTSIGDSITLGTGSTGTGGYRGRLYDLLFHNYLFGGEYQDSSKELYRFHNGIGGERTDQILTRISSNITASSLGDNGINSIILLHAGTNDCVQYVSTNTAVNNIISILDELETLVPLSNIYVALIIPNKTDVNLLSRIQSFNTALNSALITYQSTHANVIIVDQYTPFNRTNMSDEWHPDLTGYNGMADIWASCINNRNAQYCNGN